MNLFVHVWIKHKALKYFKLPPLEVLQSQWSRFVLVRALKSCVCLCEGGATNTTVTITSCDCERNYQLVVVLLQMCFPHSTQSSCAVCDLQQHISRETFLCLFFWCFNFNQTDRQALIKLLIEFFYLSEKFSLSHKLMMSKIRADSMRKCMWTR